MQEKEDEGDHDHDGGDKGKVTFTMRCVGRDKDEVRY
jgi:hypothetical protein